MKYRFILIFSLIPLSLISQEIRENKLIRVDGHDFEFLVECYPTHYCSLTIAKNGEKILSDTLDDFYDDGRFLDFNNDGHVDLLTERFSNITWNQLYLYSPNSERFEHIEGMKWFPNSRALENTPGYYYSYKRNGCADENWLSDLFVIEHQQVKRIARINGIGCPRANGEPRIDIQLYTTGEEITIIETLPINSYESYENGKREFVNTYWNENIRKFK